jgi:alpha-tubulin suppressor-like RCC1 family protein
MHRTSFRHFAIAGLGLASLLLLVQACGSSDDSTGPSLGQSFSVTIAPANLTVAPGATVTTSVTATRIGGLTAPITYEITGAPTGLVVSVSTPDATDRTTLTISAAATLAAATYPIVVNATAPGVAPQQATIAVTVSAVPDDSPAIALLAVGAHSCAVTTAGAAYCWGYNANGQLGNGDTLLVNTTPVAVVGGLRFQSIAVSQVDEVTCGLTTDGAAYCWGKNGTGQLGDGTTTRRLIPTRVAVDVAFQSLSVGASHACGVATTGTAYCWGFSPNGAFGDGSVGIRLTPAVSAPGIPLQSVVTGSDFTCGLSPFGRAYCWGLGVMGQLGNGSSASSLAPVPVSGGLTFQRLVAGGFAVCGLTNDGSAYCWGHNFYGTLGIGSSATEGGPTRSLTPVAVLGGLRFESLSAGFETICGVAVGGAGYCWGYNVAGNVGDGSTEHRSLPVRVAGGITFRSITAGTGTSCGIATTGTVYCWGGNSDGELGDGTTTDRLTPVAVRWR